MSPRPQNIGVKAIEIYFPAQVDHFDDQNVPSTSHDQLTILSASSRVNLRSSMASLRESIL